VDARRPCCAARCLRSTRAAVGALICVCMCVCVCNPITLSLMRSLQHAILRKHMPHRFCTREMQNTTSAVMLHNQCKPGKHRETTRLQRHANVCADARGASVTMRAQSTHTVTHTATHTLSHTHTPATPRLLHAVCVPGSDPWPLPAAHPPSDPRGGPYTAATAQPCVARPRWAALRAQ